MTVNIDEIRTIGRRVMYGEAPARAILADNYFSKFRAMAFMTGTIGQCCSSQIAKCITCDRVDAKWVIEYYADFFFIFDPGECVR